MKAGEEGGEGVFAQEEEEGEERSDEVSEEGGGGEAGLRDTGVLRCVGRRCAHFAQDDGARGGGFCVESVEGERELGEGEQDGGGLDGGGDAGEEAEESGVEDG